LITLLKRYQNISFPASWRVAEALRSHLGVVVAGVKHFEPSLPRDRLPQQSAQVM